MVTSLLTVTRSTNYYYYYCYYYYYYSARLAPAGNAPASVVV